jgi:hypothetical protein
MDKSKKHNASGLPQKYVGKLSDSTAKARKAHWKRMSKYSDRDPRAYKPAPGDATAKTKPSKATKEVRKIMNTEEVEITEAAENSLTAKAKKFNVPLGTLKTVYKRGVAAWNSGHRPGTTAQQWGHARVNSYLRKGKGTYHGADKDLREQNMVHSVHVKGEDKSKKFQDYVKGWGGEHHYTSDKGVAYKFKKPHQARGFTAGIKTGFRHLDAEHDGEVNEAKDSREYGYEGEMVMSQLKGVMMHAKQLHDMLEPSTDLPEWVQSKITLAYDYMQTAADYMATEMNEEVAANSVGAGNVAGLQGDPPVHMKKKKKVLMTFKRHMRK